MFAVVVDAATPYPTKDNNRFICTLKCVDHTYFTEGTAAQETYKHFCCIFYAKRPEDCPQIACVGDVIRIHRASVREY